MAPKIGGAYMYRLESVKDSNINLGIENKDYVVETSKQVAINLQIYKVIFISLKLVNSFS